MTTYRVSFILALFAVTSVFGAGTIAPEISQAAIATTICVSGWTASVRPPSRYTNAIKRQLMQRAGVDWSRRGDYELDHIVPLALGGAPRDLANLQLQPWDGPDGARAKDKMETRLKRMVCSGRMPLAVAQGYFLNGEGK